MNCKCNRCRSRRDELKSWGGVWVCNSCYDDLNPLIVKYPALSEKEERKLYTQRVKLLEELRQIERKIELGVKARKENKPYIEIRLIRP